MDPVIEDWFARRTWQEPPWTVAELVAAKAGRRVAVVLPALDEEATVGAIVAAIQPLTRGPAPLVDELVVVDSGSTDRTVQVAAAAGARVVLRTDVLPELPPVPGKGEVLWRALAATDSDVVCYLDSDLVDFDPGFVPALLGPLLTAPGVHLVKGFYRRPLRVETVQADTGGGRVTELLVRPLLAALRPELAGVVQPLGGEYAGTRELLEGLPFAAGYGVEIGLLLDTHATLGLDALAQVNLGVRKHRNRSLLQLGVMARQILAAVLARCAPAGGIAPDSGAALVQFLQVDDEWLPSATAVQLVDRPPMRELIGARTTR
jgi:glucosyl-3-phosphoglycerate synthase